MQRASLWMSRQKGRIKRQKGRFHARDMTTAMHASYTKDMITAKHVSMNASYSFCHNAGTKTTHNDAETARVGNIYTESQLWVDKVVTLYIYLYFFFSRPLAAHRALFSGQFSQTLAPRPGAKGRIILQPLTKGQILSYCKGLLWY